MSYADKVFINMCRDIIDNGTAVSYTHLTLPTIAIV